MWDIWKREGEGDMKQDEYRPPNVNDNCPREHPFEWVVCPRIRDVCFTAKGREDCAYKEYPLKNRFHVENQVKDILK